MKYHHPALTSLLDTESDVSELKNSSQGHITRLALKAIEKKKVKKNALTIKKQAIEGDLFPQFDVIETFPSKNGKTTIYHLVKCTEPNNHVCCKVLNKNANKIDQDIFLNEARRLELSQHPGVTRFIEFGHVFHRAYIMCEWAVGRSLAEIMDFSLGKGFRHDHIDGFIHQVAGAIEHMHAQGICHLDIKPSNVIVCDDDTIKLIDFGAARYIDRPEAHIQVSLKYVSPLYLASKIAKAKDDVYSLAVLTAHLFIGVAFDDLRFQDAIKKKVCGHSNTCMAFN